MLIQTKEAYCLLKLMEVIDRVAPIKIQEIKTNSQEFFDRKISEVQKTF